MVLSATAAEAVASSSASLYTDEEEEKEVFFKLFVNYIVIAIARTFFVLFCLR